MIYLTNAFSVHMIPRTHVGDEKNLQFRRISSYEAGAILRSGAFRSFYGHGESAYHLARYLKIDIPVSRGYIELKPEDRMQINACVKRIKECCPGVYLGESAALQIIEHIGIFLAEAEHE